MKYSTFKRLFLPKTLLTLFIAVFVLNVSSVWAQVVTTPLPPADPPPGLNGTPPCSEKLEHFPDQAKVPCLGILSFSESTSSDERIDIIRRAGAVLRSNFRLVNGSAVKIPDKGALSALLKYPNILRIIPDRPIRAFPKPDKPGGGKKDNNDNGSAEEVLPSGVNRIGSTEVHALGITGKDIGIAIVDTGLDFNHSDLSPSTVCFTAYSSCQDDHGHGTHVGGISAALINNSDVVGVAPGAILYAVKVLNQNGSGSDSTIMAGIDWIAQHADLIHVVNMSLGRSGTLNDNPLLRESIRILRDDYSISVVVAAGNDPNVEVSETVPATYPEVMSVASTTARDGANNRCRRFSGIISADTASYFTTDGEWINQIGVTISAPGERQENISRSCFIRSEGIESTSLGGGTTEMSGTSMAAPHVAGVIALMEEAAVLSGGLDPEVVRNILRTTAERMGDAPLHSPTSSYSYDGEQEGIVSAMGAVCAVDPNITGCP